MKSGSNFANTYKGAPIIEEWRGPAGYLHHYCDPTHAFICADSRKPQKVFVEIAGLCPQAGGKRPLDHENTVT